MSDYLPPTFFLPNSAKYFKNISLSILSDFISNSRRAQILSQTTRHFRCKNPANSLERIDFNPTANEPSKILGESPPNFSLAKFGCKISKNFEPFQEFLDPLLARWVTPPATGDQHRPPHAALAEPPEPLRARGRGEDGQGLPARAGLLLAVPVRHAPDALGCLRCT